MVEARIRVIYGDTDQMGVVYYANYLRYFELGRSEYFRQKGGSYREMEAAGLRLPVVEAHANYRASAKYDDLLLVRTEIDELRRASVIFRYAIVREGEDAVLSTGHTVHACINADGKPVPLPSQVRELLAR
ncbi:MAG: acyl-CoA thioesterase [Myxococcaceae bacterium]